MQMLAPARPDWNRLFETAMGQAGYFTTQQAAAVGFSPQLLVHHARAHRVTRVRRGIYRLVHFPADAHEELAVAWLWSERSGVVSHQTALALHELSDVLPERVHLTVPDAWRSRRLSVPADVVLHHADIAPEDRTWFGPVPVTSPRRSLNDCARDGLSPDLLQAAVRQALRRGLVTEGELGAVAAALGPYGGISA